MKKKRCFFLFHCDHWKEDYTKTIPLRTSCKINKSIIRGYSKYLCCRCGREVEYIS